MKKTIVFDLDGTLIDTAVGICNSVKYAESKLSLEPLPKEKYLEFIGPPPHESYRRLYGISQKEALLATEFHREYAAMKGIYEATVYAGMPELLAQLKQKGFLLGVATYKREELAVLILEHFKLAQYFDSIRGLDSENKLTKSDIILACIKQLGVTDRGNVIYVGDSAYDATAAQNLGIPFIGLTYGYGFSSKEDISKFSNIGFASTVFMLSEKMNGA